MTCVMMRLRCFGMARRALCFVALLFIIWTISTSFSGINIEADEFIQLSKCPVCYGNDICQSVLFNHELKLQSFSKYRFSWLMNAKNVYYGLFRGQQVVVKKLGHDSELASLDYSICNHAKQSRRCDIHEAIKRIQEEWSVQSSHEENRVIISPLFVRNVSSGLKCASDRLMNHLHDAVANVSRSQVSHILSLLMLNLEGILIQAFPGDHWPFPRYIGTCGRILVEEYVGPSLDHYQNAEWMTRLDLAYQLLQIAELLTHNKFDFALYLTDVSFHNFAVGHDNKVRLVDVEDVLIVDKKEVRKSRPPNWDKPYAHTIEGCMDCMSYSIDDLCNRELSDHNYYAICKSLLSSNPYSKTVRAGLLHSIPAEVEQNWNLRTLIEECAIPRTEMGRFNVMPKLMKTMRVILRIQSE